MQHEKEHIQELLKRYQQGQVSGEEKKRIAQWLYGLDALEESPSEDVVQQNIERSQTELRQHFFPAHEHSKRKVFFLPRIWAVAASLLLVLLGGLWYYQQQHHVARTQQAAIFSEISTAAGETKQIALPDGTQIVLNNQSSLKYPAHFTDSTRLVYLEGEAFFKVSKNKEKPFIVQSSTLNIRVLGTSFNVKSYQEEDKASVSVATGKVSVAAAKNSNQLLLSGEEVVLDKRVSRLTKTTVSADDIGSWQRGHLIFKEEPLSAIAAQLARRYRVDFEFKNPELKEKVLNLSIKNQPFNSVMDALAISGEFSYHRNGDIITLW